MSNMFYWQDAVSANLPIIFIVALLALYCARDNAHVAIRQLSFFLYNNARSLAIRLTASAQSLGQWLKDYYRASAQENLQRQVDLELDRLHKIIEKDLRSFNRVQLRLEHHIETLEEDYEGTTLLPEPVAEWENPLALVDQLKQEYGNVKSLEKNLVQIATLIESQQRDAMREYRWALNTRHKLLATLRPRWRQLNRQKKHLSAKIELVLARAEKVDALLEKYHQVATEVEASVYPCLPRFLASTLLLAVGGFAALVNYHLLEQPLTQFFAFSDATAEFSLGSLAAGFYTAMIVLFALLISESKVITRLFPMLSGFASSTRTLLMLMSGGMLLLLALCEAVLVSSFSYNHAAALQLPAIGIEWAGLNAYSLLAIAVIPVIAVLALSVLPLEGFLQTLPLVAGMLVQGMFAGVAFVLRLSGRVCKEMGRLLIKVYDLAIFLPLWLEQRYMLWRQGQQGSKASSLGDSFAGTNVKKVDFDNLRNVK